MRRLDMIIAIAVMLAAVIALVGTSDLPYFLSDEVPGPAFMPLLVGIVALVLGAVLFIQALRGDEDDELNWPGRSGFRRIILCVLALIALMAAAPYVGLVPGFVIFLLFMLLVVERRAFWPSMLTTLVTMALVEGVFVQWLRVSVPYGPFGF